MKREEKNFEIKYGYFTDDGREYVIKRPDTPRPWINVICNGDYGITVSQAGGGYSWWKNSDMARITRWIQDTVRDRWGKFIYLKDVSSGEIWSLGWKPVQKDFDEYECRHGLGYTTITNSTNKIHATATFFVPPNEPIEIWKITLRNDSNRSRHINLTSFFEWALGNSTDTHREFQKTFIETWYEPGLNALCGKKRPHLVPGFIGTGLTEWPCTAFHSSNVKPTSYEGDKESFIGMYGDLDNPKGLRKDKLSNNVGKFNDSVAALQLDAKLNKNQERVFIFTVGYMEDKPKARRLIKKYASIKNVDQALEKTKAFWEDLVSGFKVDSNDKGLDYLTNYWLKYQAISGRMWARSAYYQSSGGFGFRDQLQDSQVLLPLDATKTKEQILLHARHQFFDGTVYHWWHPLTEVGAHTGMTDDLLWLAYVTLSYLDETDDVGILNKKEPYVDNKKKDTLFVHCMKSIDKVLSRFSKRGLPLIGEGDWNDGMSLVGVNWKGESIWLGHFLYGVLIRFAEVCKRKRSFKKQNVYLKKAKKLKEAINKYAWDGQWYIRATRDDGKPMGSKSCKEGKIFLNAQTWSIISGSSEGERGKKAMESARKFLYEKYGPILFRPAYSTPDTKIGYLTRYAPGARENGGLYSHAAMWAIMAECVLGNGDRAYELYSKLSPVKRGMEPDFYKVEPYSMPGNVDGPDSENFGRGVWTWYTGSAAWLFRVVSEWIFGIRPSREGLIIDPCIPKKWSRFKVKRLFRGAIYHIEVHNPEGVSKGITKLTIDGKRHFSNIIPPLSKGKSCRIKVLLG